MAETIERVCDCGCGSSVTKQKNDEERRTMTGWVHLHISIDRKGASWCTVDIAPGCWPDIHRVFKAIDNRMKESDEYWRRSGERYDRQNEASIKRVLESMGWSRAEVK